MQWPASTKSLKNLHTLKKLKCSHSLFESPSENVTFDAISGHPTQSNPIRAIPPRIRPNPIQFNPIHG